MSSLSLLFQHFLESKEFTSYYDAKLQKGADIIAKNSVFIVNCL